MRSHCTFDVSNVSRAIIFAVTADMQRKLNHLTVLARALLPSSDNIEVVQQRLHKLIGSADGGDDEECQFGEVPLMSLRQIRKAAIAADAHQQAWYENNGITPHKFSVGDLGYLPKRDGSEEKDWANFVVLCNVLEDGLASLETTRVKEGQQGGWQGGFHKWDTLTPFELPGGVDGYALRPSLPLETLANQRQMDRRRASRSRVQPARHTDARRSTSARRVELPPRYR